ncbi:MAG TPA: SGNH/GDSL hydrolase family protein, partial [Leptospiraceae bacterium]|nr:SGNH/GDSL hydrolase family protein [Leptospiraceae bacterium]
MKEYIKFITDKRFLIPLAILTVIEIFLQTGVFRPYLKKNSYASNINRITDHILSHKEDHNPDILILGTS